MSRYESVRGIDVVILCGGRGKRLRAVLNDRPKSMAEFGQQPFLSIIMEYVASFGFKRFILCTGYMGEIIRKYYSTRLLPWEILYSQEKKTLGTGGAIKKAEGLIESNPFLVMNGDSFCQINFYKFIDFHFKKKALLSIVLARDNNKNCGKVTLDNAERIIGFEEKAISKDKCFNNVGIYLMDRAIFSLIEKRKRFSLEYDIFPFILNERCYGFRQKLDLIDIGTPNEYRRARQLFLKGYFRSGQPR